PHAPDLLVVLELVGWPEHPNGPSPRFADEAQKPWLLNRNIEVAGLFRSIAQRSPRNALALDRFSTGRMDTDSMSAPCARTDTTNDARLRAPEGACFEVSTIVIGCSIGN